MSLREAVTKEPKTVQVEAFGETVTVTEIGALDRLAYVEYLQRLQAEGASDERIGLLVPLFLMVKSAVEDGKRVFADDEVESLASRNLDMDDLNKVFRASAELNALLASDEGN